MKRNKPSSPEVIHQRFEVGTKVRVIRPNILWSGCEGVVQGVNKSGVHTCSISYDRHHYFPIYAVGSELEKL